MATPPRMLPPSSTVMVTWRVLERPHRLRPSREENQLTLHLLAIAAERYAVKVHAFQSLGESGQEGGRGRWTLARRRFGGIRRRGRAGCTDSFRVCREERAGRSWAGLSAKSQRVQNPYSLCTRRTDRWDCL